MTRLESDLSLRMESSMLSASGVLVVASSVRVWTLVSAYPGPQFPSLTVYSKYFFSEGKNRSSFRKYSCIARLQCQIGLD